MNTDRNSPDWRHQESGSAMLLALLTLLVLGLLGTGFMVQGKNETQMSGHHVRDAQALFNAEAGQAEALARVSRDSVLAPPQGAWTTEPGWGRYIVASTGASASDPWGADTASDGLDNDDDGDVDETGERFPEVLTSQSGETIDYPWVRVQYRIDGGLPVLFGDHDDDPLTPPAMNTTVGDPVLLVTSRGQQGTANRTIEVEAVRVPVEIESAALYAESSDFTFNGTQFLISGQDWDPDFETPTAGPEVLGITTTGDPSDVTGALNHQQENNVEGAGSEPAVGSATVDMDLQSMADDWSQYAEYTLPSGTYSNQAWGGRTDYTVVHCTGDMHTSGTSAGGGLLIVDGDLDCSGQFTWYGIVLVLGDVTFTGGGAGVHIWGSLLVQGNIDAQAFSGNTDILYSSMAIQRLTSLFPYTVANWRER